MEEHTVHPESKIHTPHINKQYILRKNEDRIQKWVLNMKLKENADEQDNQNERREKKNKQKKNPTT
jgi:hypothetical protein